MYTVTISMLIHGQDVTIELERDNGDDAIQWHVKQALDESGKRVLLTKSQKTEAIKRAGHGEDETGR